MPETKILRGSTQTLVSYPRVSDGGDLLRAQPSAVTVRIQTPAVAMPDDTAWVAATVDSVSTTVDTGAVEGATYVQLVGSVALVRGRQYLIANGSGDTLVVESTKSATSDDLYLAEPLVAAPESGATFKGYAVSKALTTAQTETAGTGVAYWKATIGGLDYVWAQAFRIVRRMPRSVVTPSSLTRDCPEILKKRARSDVDLEEVIRSAWVHEILPWSSANGIVEEDIVSAEALEPLHVQACLVRLLRNREDTSSEYFARVNDRYEQLKLTTLARSDWFEVNQQVEAPPTHEPGARDSRRNAVRLVR